MRKAIQDIRLVIFESAITSGLIAFPIISLFYLDLGLTQEQIALTQVAFTAIVTALNVPCGWLADRFGRKWANVFGDLICAIGIFLYAGAQGVWQIVVCECLLGIGNALSQGVDSSLLKHFCDKEHRPFRDNYAKMTRLCLICSLTATLICGPISQLGYRATIAISAIPYFIGTIASLLIHDDSERIPRSQQNVFKEILQMARRNLKNRQLRIRVMAYAITREMTHGVIWFFAPLLASFGWSVTAIAIAVAVNEFCKVIGATLAEKFAKRLKDWQIFLIPVAAVSIGSLVMTLCLSQLTIGFFACFGLACGWVSATMMPMVKEEVQPSEQSTVESAARVFASMLYMISVWLINLAAGISYQLGFAAVLVIFVPLAGLVLPKMRQSKP